MKNLKKFLPLFAFILGIGLVFTQSAFKSAEVKTNEWYLLDASGNIDPSHTVVDPETLCPIGEAEFCAGEFAVIDGEPSGPRLNVRMKD